MCWCRVGLGLLQTGFSELVPVGYDVTTVSVLSSLLRWAEGLELGVSLPSEALMTSRSGSGSLVLAEGTPSEQSALGQLRTFSGQICR